VKGGGRSYPAYGLDNIGNDHIGNEIGSVANNILPVAIIYTGDLCGTSTLETYYSNFVARPLYAQKVPVVSEDWILASRCSRPAAWKL